MGDLFGDAHVDGIGEALREMGGEGGGGPGETLEGDGELVGVPLDQHLEEAVAFRVQATEDIHDERDGGVALYARSTV